MSLTAPIWSARCTCGPRQRSVKPPWTKSVMSSPSGMSARRATFNVSPIDSKSAFASARDTTRRSKAAFSATMRRISSSTRAMSSGVKGRSTRKSYWNFSEWSLRPTSTCAAGKRRFTASAITCSAEWRITSPPCGSLFVTISIAASRRSGRRRSTRRPSTRPASAARASPGPMRSATPRTVVPAGTASCLPSGRRTWISLMRGVKTWAELSAMSQIGSSEPVRGDGSSRDGWHGRD